MTKQKKTIAIIGSKGIYSEYGGVEKLVFQICSAFGAYYDIIVYGIKHYQDPETHNPLKIRSIDFVLPRIPFFDVVISSLFATLSAFWHRVDLYYFHACGPALFAFIPFIFRKKIVWHFHGADYSRSIVALKMHKRSGIRGIFYVLLELTRYLFLKTGERVAVHTADIIFVLGDFHYRQYKRRFPKHIKKFRKVSNFISSEKMDADENAPRSESQCTKNSIISVSRLVPEKRIDLLINAFHHIKEEFSELELIIIGKGREEDFLRQVAGKESRIHFVGALPHKEIFTFYKNALLLCLCSEIEGQPLAILEAMKSKCAIIARDLFELREFGEDAVFFFKGDSIMNLVEMLRFIIPREEERKRKIEQASTLFQQQYSSERVLPLIKREFDELLSK